MAQRRPDLTRESGDRGFSAGAGDGGDGARLARIELGGDQRQRAPGIADPHESDRIRITAHRAAAPPGWRPRRAAIAGPTKRRPSVLPPAIATNRSPLVDRAAVRASRRRCRDRHGAARFPRRGAESREASWRSASSMIRKAVVGFPKRSCSTSVLERSSLQLKRLRSQRAPPYLLSFAEASIR